MSRSFTFYRRFYGQDVGRGPVTSQLELTEDRKWLILRPASVQQYACVLSVKHTTKLVNTILLGADCTLDCPGEMGGPRRLTLAVAEVRWNLTVTVAASDAITLAFSALELHHLVSHLDDGLAFLTGRNSFGGTAE
ncbi:hypothetical protein [Actinoalloteichus hymeniacidonis]|nr:hypothetical protein [Actinoalloteichus hymeniacidonis]MBB5911060.1 hypothetical protein [Actinoalloteichus hymeniacidonis]